MTDEQKHEMLKVSAEGLRAAATMHRLARQACAIPENCVHTSSGWMAWDDEESRNYATATIAEGIEVAFVRLAAMKEAKK